MAMSNSQVAIRRRARWQELLRRWRSSGLPQAEFCRRREIPAWKFTWWKKRLGAERVVPPSPFVPVQVMAPPPSGELELTLRGGRMLRFGADVEGAKLAGIVSALEALCPDGPAC